MATLRDVLAWLEAQGSPREIEAQKRYGITATRPFGVGVGVLKREARALGTDHRLAQGLWKTGRYEARLLASMVGDPDALTVREMDAWARDFDSWAVVDTVCFHLFDRSPHAWSRVRAWAGARPEFTKRAAFALVWALSVHDKAADDAPFLDALGLVEAHATDGREPVKKAVDMALRAVGKRDAALHVAARATAGRLAANPDPHAAWIGRHAERELARVEPRSSGRRRKA